MAQSWGKGAFSEERPGGGGAGCGKGRPWAPLREERSSLPRRPTFWAHPCTPAGHFCLIFLVTTAWIIMTQEISVHCPFFCLLSEWAGVMVWTEEGGPSNALLRQKTLHSVTQGKVRGHAVLHVPGGYIVFGISRANDCQPEKSKTKQQNDLHTHQCPLKLTLLSTMNLWFKWIYLVCMWDSSFSWF